MTKAHLDKLEDYAIGYERGSYRDWLLNDVIPAHRRREAGKAAVSRRWKGHEAKPEAIKRREHRERQARYRETKAVNSEALQSRPEVIKQERIKVPAREFNDDERALLRAGWTMSENNPDGSLWLNPPKVAPQAPTVPTRQPAAPEAPMTARPSGTKLMEAVIASLEDDDLETLKESVSWPRTPQQIEDVCERVGYDYDKLRARAFKIIDSIRAEKASDVLDV